MNLLLDTCTFLWLTLEPEELSPKALELCENVYNKVFLSPLSTWEIILKYRLGKLTLRIEPNVFVATQRLLHKIEDLPFEEADALWQIRLENHHKDPFDRMLICQALEHNIPIVTPDTKIMKYDVDTIW